MEAFELVFVISAFILLITLLIVIPAWPFKEQQGTNYNKLPVNKIIKENINPERYQPYQKKHIEL